MGGIEAFNRNSEMAMQAAYPENRVNAASALQFANLTTTGGDQRTNTTAAEFMIDGQGSV